GSAASGGRPGRAGRTGRCRRRPAAAGPRTPRRPTPSARTRSRLALPGALAPAVGGIAAGRQFLARCGDGGTDAGAVLTGLLVLLDEQGLRLHPGDGGLDAVPDTEPADPDEGQDAAHDEHDVTGHAQPLEDHVAGLRDVPQGASLVVADV